MSRQTSRFPWHLSVASLAFVLIAPAAASAQVGGPGFLFTRPRVQLELRTGYSVARAGSDVYTAVTDSLTLNKSDFNAFMIGGDLSFRVTSRLDAGLDFAYTGGSRPSQVKPPWVDNNNLPIQQTTKFSRIPLTVRLKWYLMPPGQSISRFAWIPTTWAPYVGVGAGVMWYSLDQSGSFVDWQSAPTYNIYTDNLHSSGSAPTADVFAGADVTLNKIFFLTGEARYDWAKATLGQDFVGFNKIDLSGFQASVGIGIRF